MELAHAQHHPPPLGPPPKRLLHGSPQDDQADGIEGAQHGPDHELRVPEAGQGHERLADAGEQHGADKGARHGAGEDEVVVRRGQAGVDVVRGRAVGEDVVRGLQVEGLFDLCVGRGEEVQQGDDEEEEVCGC